MRQEEIWDVDAAQVYDTSGAGIPAVVGEMATAGAPGKYTLVYLVYNTISNLLTQAEQVACFRNAARHWGSGRTPADNPTSRNGRIPGRAGRRFRRLVAWVEHRDQR
jgi:hypothetical protein